MPTQSDLRHEMSAVRNRGLANATELGERVEKLSDWREHVRAHPWPIALAAGALACWAVPRRRVARHSTNGADTVLPAMSRSADAPTEREVKTASAAGLGGALMGFAGSLIGNAVRSYVSEQVQTLITSRGNHAPSQQRKTSFSDF